MPGYGRRPWLLFKEVADALSLEEETWKTFGISKGEWRGCPRVGTCVHETMTVAASLWEMCLHHNLS